MAYFVKNIQKSGELFKHQFNGIDLNSLASSIDDVFVKQGYKLKNGQPGNGEYEKGNRIMRLLFGAFVKYFKFFVKLKQAEDQSIELLVTKTSSGFSGGLIGIGQVKKELNRLSEILSQV
jgi:hypothetical protein